MQTLAQTAAPPQYINGLGSLVARRAGNAADLGIGSAEGRNSLQEVA